MNHTLVFHDSRAETRIHPGVGCEEMDVAVIAVVVDTAEMDVEAVDVLTDVVVAVVAVDTTLVLEVTTSTTRTSITVRVQTCVHNRIRILRQRAEPRTTHRHLRTRP